MQNENTISCAKCHGHLWLKSLVLVIMGTIVIVALLRERIVDRNQNVVTVTGIGKISYQPNTATVNLGADVNNAQTSQQALDELNKKVSQIISAVTNAGISKNDISTQNYALNPHYDYKDGRSTVSGYDANQQIIVKIKDVGSDQQKVNDVLTAAGNAGSNNIQNVSFESADTSDLKQQAQIAAINDARQKVQELAKAAGVRVGEVIGWQTHQNDGIMRPLEANTLGLSDKEIAQANVPAGTKDMTVEVDVKFELE